MQCTGLVMRAILLLKRDHFQAENFSNKIAKRNVKRNYFKKSIFCLKDLQTMHSILHFLKKIIPKIKPNFEDKCRLLG